MFIIGRKLEMTQIWDEEGRVVPVTKIACPPSTVAGFRTKDKDGYEAVIISSGSIVREFRKYPADLKEKAAITVSNFKKGDKVKVVGTSKGKGYQGVVKRHNFSGGGKTHGHRHDLRRPGSIGSAFPQHVLKGKRMAGRMGADRVTVKNLAIASIDEEKGIMLLKGAVPGTRGSLIIMESKDLK